MEKTVGRKKTIKSSGSEQQVAEDALFKRMEECQLVIDHLKNCPAWVVIKNDLTINKQWVDDNWQDITDDVKLQRARELKLAYNHLINIEGKYHEDLESINNQIKAVTSTHKEIIKDYDTE